MKTAQRGEAGPSARAALARDEAMRILKTHEREIRAQGVTRLALFGSTARGEARPDSDVDVLVDFDRSRQLSLLDIAGLEIYLGEILGREIETANRERLKPFLKDNVLAEAIEVFPRFGHRDPIPKGGAMPERTPRQRVHDMLEAIEAVQRYIAGRRYEDYLTDDLLRAGVERRLEVISEATRRLPAALLEAHPSIPWQRIRAVGNILRHEYDQVFDDVIWNIAKTELGPLKTAVEAMVAEVEKKTGR